MTTRAGARWANGSWVSDAWLATAATAQQLPGGPHTHPETDVTNLPTDLASKAATGHTHNAYAATSHSHPESDVTSLVSDLSGKAASGHTHVYAATAHTHAEADTTNLVSDLAGKATSGHTHDAAYATIGHTHASAAPTLKTAEIDFGSAPAGPMRFAVADAAISPASVVLIQQSGATPTGGFGGEAELDPLLVTAMPGAGVLMVAATPLAGKVLGKMKLTYLIGA